MQNIITIEHAEYWIEEVAKEEFEIQGPLGSRHPQKLFIVKALSLAEAETKAKRMIPAVTPIRVRG